VWPATITQPCIVQLLRTCFRYASRQHWDAIAKARFGEFPRGLRPLRDHYPVVGQRLGRFRATVPRVQDTLVAGPVHLFGVSRIRLVVLGWLG
jgi:hypothetical protein